MKTRITVSVKESDDLRKYEWPWIEPRQLWKHVILCS